MRFHLGLGPSSRGRRGRADSELQRWEFWTIGFLLLPLAVGADEVEVVLLGIFFVDAKAATVLPHIALLTSNAVAPVVLKGC
jgi:hypothetical protein